jgi:hypothetical protein
MQMVSFDFFPLQELEQFLKLQHGALASRNIFIWATLSKGVPQPSSAIALL